MNLKKQLGPFDSKYCIVKTVLLSPRRELENAVRCRQRINLLEPEFYI